MDLVKQMKKFRLDRHKESINFMATINPKIFFNYIYIRAKETKYSKSNKSLINNQIQESKNRANMLKVCY